MREMKKQLIEHQLVPISNNEKKIFWFLEESRSTKTKYFHLLRRKPIALRFPTKEFHRLKMR